MESEPKTNQAERVPIYPLRPSELVQHPERVTNDVEPLALSTEDWEQISQLERPLAERLEMVDDRHLKIYQHHYYPVYFSGEAGEQRFHVLYETGLVRDAVEQACASHGVDLTAESIRKVMYGAALEDAALWSWPVEPGTELELPSLTAAIQAKAEGHAVATISLAVPSIDQPEGDQRERFLALDLNNTSPEYFTAIQAVSGRKAEEQFEQAFAEANGETGQLDNPERIARIVNTGDLLHKMTELRAIRAEVKQLEHNVDGDGALPEAERIVLSLYRERINAMIAQEYPNVRLLENDNSVSPVVPAIRAETALPAHSPISSLQRINRFLRGVGVTDEGVYAEIPSRLAEYVDNQPQIAESNEESEQYNSYKINAQQMQQLLQLLVAHYVGEDARPWEVLVDPRVRALAVDGKKHIVSVPQKFSNGAVNTVTVAEHEGGHVLQAVNRERATDDRLELTRRFVSSRNRVLSEAGAMEVEREAKQQMVGVDRQALPYFYDGLRAKEAGGTFTECYAAMFASYAERNGTTVAALCQSSEYKKASSYVYARALRLFNVESGLDSPDSGLTSTEQLGYIEQETVVPIMKEHGLGSLVYVAGVDLYSLQKLQRLGVVDVDKIQTPDLYLAKNFWPYLKAQIAIKETFNEAWDAAIQHVKGENNAAPESVEQLSVDGELETVWVELGFCAAGELAVPTAEEFAGLDSDGAAALRDAYYDRLEAMREERKVSDLVANVGALLGRAALQWRRGLRDVALSNVADAKYALEQVNTDPKIVASLVKISDQMKAASA